MALATLTFAEFKKLAKEGMIQETDLARCPRDTCNVILQETITGNRQVGEEHVCSDCYFEDFGKMIDQRPIGMPRR